MRKSKKFLALTLAALQILMLLPSTGISVYAEEPEAVTESAESDVVEEVEEPSGVANEDAEVSEEDALVEEGSGVLDAGASEDTEPAEDDNAGVTTDPSEEAADDAKPTEEPVVDNNSGVENEGDVPADENAGVSPEGTEEVSEEPEEEPEVFYTLKVVDTYSDTEVSDVRYEEQLPAGQGYSFSALEVDNYVVDGDAEYQGELTEDTTLEFIYLREYTVTFYDIVAEEVISEVTVRAGEAAEAPEVPVYEGFEFVGWSEEFNEVFCK